MFHLESKNDDTNKHIFLIQYNFNLKAHNSINYNKSLNDFDFNVKSIYFILYLFQ